MELVKDRNDILENAKRFDEYLTCDNVAEHEFALQALTRGRCFVVIKNNEKFKFYPSKFVGYKNNSVKDYNDCLGTAEPLSEEKSCLYGDAAYFDFDGRMSNKAINAILKCKCINDYAMSERFIEYCQSLGLKGSDKKKFWLAIIEER